MRILLLLLVLASCSPIYVSNTRNAPLFREQGEAQISGYITSGGIELQGAYAITDHIGAIGSYAYGSSPRETADKPPISYTRRNAYGEIGLGLFDRSRSFRYEVFLGYGFGGGTSYDQYYFFTPKFGLSTLVTDAKMRRYFIQPSIGTNNKDFNIIFTPRVAMVDYYEFTAKGITVKPGELTPPEKPVLYLEPALTGKLRLKGNIHAIFQLGINVPIGDSYFDYQPMQAGLGIQIDTGGLRTRVYK